jgi:ubiquinone/menaquinone biosynthesis C-methylase UbiE
MKEKSSHSEERKNEGLFNRIAPVYGLFFSMQRGNFRRILKQIEGEVDLSRWESVLDVGCGTGALCSVLAEEGFVVTGVDPARRMLEIAKRKAAGQAAGQAEGQKIAFVEGNALEGLSFPDNSFDVAIASYVAHGLQKQERQKLYAEMSRVARDMVIIHDYNKERSLLTSIVEWMEGGDYFRFIQQAEQEMKDCVVEMSNCFSEVRVLRVGTRASWYLCKPK